MYATFKTDPEVDLICFAASDEDVVRAARVSVHGRAEVEPGDVRGLIGHMMRNRHGSVFEHNLFTFRVYCPIFTAREFMRHRTFSFNEESARYRELEPVFWLPGPERKLRQEGKPSAYKLAYGSHADYLNARNVIREASENAYTSYRVMLDDGIAREVARAVLPVNTFTSFWATCNARALMNFLSLRVDDPGNAVETHPQYEIQQVASQMESFFCDAMPITVAAWRDSGRVAP